MEMDTALPTSLSGCEGSLTSFKVLVHFDPKLGPVILECDASQYGIGAVIPHTFPNGHEMLPNYANVLFVFVFFCDTSKALENLTFIPNKVLFCRVFVLL